jgi:hypothetical protein
VTLDLPIFCILKRGTWFKRECWCDHFEINKISHLKVRIQDSIFMLV